MTEENEVKDPEGLLKAYNKAKEDLVTLRTQLKTLEDERTALEEAAEQFPTDLARWRDRAVKSEVRKTLEEQGIKNPDRIIKYVDLEGVDFDENDKLTGLDDKINSVKADFPELFDVKRRAARQSVDIHADAPAKSEKTGTDAQIERLFAKK